MPKKNDEGKKQVVFALDPVALNELQKAEEVEQAAKLQFEAEGGDTSALDKKSTTLHFILDSLNKHEDVQQRMAFEVDPFAGPISAYGGIYRQKTGLTPDHILKKITGPQGDDLVNQILQARSNIISSFGRPRTSRFAVGFEFQEINSDKEAKTPEEAEKAKATIEKTKEIMWNCGFKGLSEDWHPNLSQFLKMITRDGLTYGRVAVEFISAKDPANHAKEICHSFRAVDSGTIYRIMPSQKRDKTRRKQALQLLQQIQNKKFDVQKYDQDEYKWVQVINGQVAQVFTEKELVVYNIYPTTNVEYNSYPLTPIDQALNAIATHINITIHNKLFFEHGRASRGMLVFKSDDIDEGTIQKIRLQFHQSINSAQNSWRMPVFAVGSADDVSWQSIDVAGRDKEFQYLSDDNARVILGAFQISPEELPGYAHLSRGTNTQALSESDNEYKLTAARDVGLRPLIYDMQDLFNTHILPRFDHELSKTHQLVFAGLEHDSPEREATRISQDMSIHMTYADILEKVEKKKLPKELGGELPLNPQFQQSIAPYLTVGVILENFFGVKDASKDPRYNYVRDPFWLQYQQLMIQKAQMAMQAQMQMQQAQQQQAMAEQQGQQGQEQPQEEGQEQQSDEGSQPPPAQGQPVQKTEEWLEHNHEHLSKGIANNHSMITKMILSRHKELTDKRLKEWSDQSKKALKDVMNAVKGKLEE